MLVIKKEQIQQFIAKDDADLIRLIRQILREVCPGRVENYSDLILDGMVKFGLEKARKYQFTQAETIAAFVTSMFELAPDFDEHAQFRTVLEDEKFPPDERFSQLWQRVDDRYWDEVENSYDASVWFPDK
jgi:hypothetical protein